MTHAPTPLKIDFVSDLSCPWCAIGLHALMLQTQRELGFDVATHDFSRHPERLRGELEAFEIAAVDEARADVYGIAPVAEADGERAVAHCDCPCGCRARASSASTMRPARDPALGEPLSMTRCATSR